MVTTEYLMKNYDLSILLHKIVAEDGSMNATDDVWPNKVDLRWLPYWIKFWF